MKVRFTKHAQDKFILLERHGVLVTEAQVLTVLQNPDMLDSESRAPLIVAQGPFDERRVLRVVYRVEYATMVVVTFYPGRRSQYES